MSCSYSRASVGTTEDTMAASTSLMRRSRSPSSEASTAASSSAVAKRTVAKRQCSTSSSSEKTPRWVWVLPTSIARSTRRLFRAAHPRADSKQVAVEVDHAELTQAVVGLLRGSMQPRDALIGQIQALELGMQRIRVVHVEVAAGVRAPGVEARRAEEVQADVPARHDQVLARPQTGALEA